VARKPTPDHPELPFDPPGPSPELALRPVEPTPKSTRKMGRPRKWGTEAERKRAYRERLAADLAEPQRLRHELRNARRTVAEKGRRLAQAERELAAAEAEIERRTQREAELNGTVERLEARLEDWRSRANALARTLQAERIRTVPSTDGPSDHATPVARPKPPANRNRSRKKNAKRRRRK
jgi:predicted RNase H-like nuclease (RuvC/YqgF family)